MQENEQKESLEFDADIENRFTYHPPKGEEQAVLYGAIRDFAKDFAYFIKANVPAGREQALAITKLEEMVMWANAGISRGK